MRTELLNIRAVLVYKSSELKIIAHFHGAIPKSTLLQPFLLYRVVAYLHLQFIS